MFQFGGIIAVFSEQRQILNMKFPVKQVLWLLLCSPLNVVSQLFQLKECWFSIDSSVVSALLLTQAKGQWKDAVGHHQGRTSSPEGSQAWASRAFAHQCLTWGPPSFWIKTHWAGCETRLRAQSKRGSLHKVSSWQKEQEGTRRNKKEQEGSWHWLPALQQHQGEMGTASAQACQ